MDVKKLNIGCGKEYIEGWINLDSINVKKDVKHDLNKIPWPFKDSIFKEVLMKSVLEHLNNPIKIVKEVIRISKKGAKLVIIVPHARSLASVTDIQHKTYFTENSFCPELLKEYELSGLILKRADFIYKNKWKKYIPFKKAFNIFLNSIYDDLLFEFEIAK